MPQPFPAKLDAETVQHMLNDYGLKMPRAELLARYGVSKATLLWHRRKHGIAPRAPRRPVTSPVVAPTFTQRPTPVVPRKGPPRHTAHKPRMYEAPAAPVIAAPAVLPVKPYEVDLGSRGANWSAQQNPNWKAMGLGSEPPAEVEFLVNTDIPNKLRSQDHRCSPWKTCGALLTAGNAHAVYNDMSRVASIVCSACAAKVEGHMK